MTATRILVSLVTHVVNARKVLTPDGPAGLPRLVEIDEPSPNYNEPAVPGR